MLVDLVYPRSGPNTHIYKYLRYTGCMTVFKRVLGFCFVFTAVLVWSCLVVASGGNAFPVRELGDLIHGLLRS